MVSLSLLKRGSLDFGWRDGHTIILLQHVLTQYRLAIHADQKILGSLVRHLLLEEFLDSGVVRNLNMICEPIKLSTNLAIRTRLQNRT